MARSPPQPRGQGQTENPREKVKARKRALAGRVEDHTCGQTAPRKVREKGTSHYLQPGARGDQAASRTAQVPSSGVLGCPEKVESLKEMVKERAKKGGMPERPAAWAQQGMAEMSWGPPLGQVQWQNDMWGQWGGDLCALFAAPTAPTPAPAPTPTPTAVKKAQAASAEAKFDWSQKKKCAPTAVKNKFGTDRQ